MHYTSLVKSKKMSFYFAQQNLVFYNYNLTVWRTIHSLLLLNCEVRISGMVIRTLGRSQRTTSSQQLATDCRNILAQIAKYSRGHFQIN